MPITWTSSASNLLDANETSRLLFWISESVLRGVWELDVSMFFKAPQMLPHGVYTCKTLTDLTISGNFILDVPEGVLLPRVKTIWLFHASFMDSDSVRRLFKSWTVLENLVISLSHTGDIQVIEISVPTLKSLDVIQNYDDNYELVLNAPSIEYLEYIGYVARTNLWLKHLLLFLRTSTRVTMRLRNLLVWSVMFGFSVSVPIRWRLCKDPADHCHYYVTWSVWR